MKVLYLSPKGVSNPDLVELVTKIGRTHDVGTASCIFVDLFSYIQPINEDIIIQALVKKKPLVFFDERDYGGMSTEIFMPESFNLLAKQLKVVYFMRKMNKTIQYPPYVYPYEKCIMNEFPLVSKEELFNRPYDFCFIGNESPQRRNTANGLLDAGFKGLVHWTNEKGKLPHNEWVELHRQAKFFLESDGGGFGSERHLQLMTIAPMLRQRNDMLRNNDWEDVTECLDISENVSSDDETMIQFFLNNQNSLYSVYKKGVERLNTYFTEEAMRNYILDVLKQNKIK